PYADFNSTGSVLNRYLADPRAIDAFFARTDGAGNNTAWYLADMLGSVREIVNTSGTVLDDIRYDSFGNILSESSPSNGDRFKFAGMQWDSEIGQYYVWHRDYLAGPGRFETEDPLGLGPDANAYRYVGNNPVDRTDPTGLFSFFHFDEWIRQKVEQVKEGIKERIRGAVRATIDRIKEEIRERIAAAREEFKRSKIGLVFEYLNSPLFAMTPLGGGIGEAGEGAAAEKGAQEAIAATKAAQEAGCAAKAARIAELEKEVARLEDLIAAQQAKEDSILFSSRQ